MVVEQRIIQSIIQLHLGLGDWTNISIVFTRAIYSFICQWVRLLIMMQLIEKSTEKKVIALF